MATQHTINAVLIAAIFVYVIECSQLADIYVRNGKALYTLDVTSCPELERTCSHIKDDLALLSCSLEIAHSNKTQISTMCQHKLWKYQAQMMDKSFLDSKLSIVCQQEPMIFECLNNNNEQVIDCILKKKSSVRDRICWQTISRIESLIFNDWQLTRNFLKYCFEEAESYTCGRIPKNSTSMSQINTIECLQNIQNLNVNCTNELSSLQETKYSTFQLDKVVFAACFMEQKAFCSDETPGSWLLYKCLMKHKYEKGVTRRCQDQLFFDQRNIVMNFGLSKGLVKACKQDIRKYNCRKGVVEEKEVRLAQILLCLENVTRNDSTKISPLCNVEMIDHRKMLMEDYRLSPELMQNCANDIRTLCKGVSAGGKTIHCLMENARPKRRGKRISPDCHRSLEELLVSADPGEDWRVDPILRKACQPVVISACGDVNGGNGRVMSCLMEKLGTALMTNECETALMQIQYFISRDFRLDPQLYKACQYDAVVQCKAKMQWANLNEHQSEKDPLVLPCLYKYAYNSEYKGVLKPSCEQQVRRTMRLRAISVDLMPEIEDACIDDLINFCLGNSGKGEEIACLQDNLSKLNPKCKGAISNFTETQSGNIELNSVVSRNCRAPIKRFCSTEMKGKDYSDGDDVMECLIKHKNTPEIKANNKCKAAIDHEQLISLKNYRFTRKFKNACKSYVLRFCPKAQTKVQVVTCLSEIVRNDTITRRKHTIFKDCRQQLRSQLFQQRESIDLDPELKSACQRDLDNLCANIPKSEAAALECLQTSKSQLSDACRKAVFVVKEQEFSDNAADFHLVTSCSDMIDLYCHNTEPAKVLECLKAHKEDPEFDDQCKLVVVNRMIEQNSDYRYNNNLQYACKLDIQKHCAKIIENQPQDFEMQGKMLYCLKEKFRQSQLTSACENELANVLKEQALNYRLDPLLSRLCSAEIQILCSRPDDSLTKSDGWVEECLKNALLARKIVAGECARELVQLIEESEVDIDADPLLERACALDVLKYCKNLDNGAGRRLNCLKIIMSDEKRELEPECHKELSTRLQMYKFVAAANVIDGLGDMYEQINTSPSKKYFLVIGFSIVGLIFIFGLYCGRLTKKAMYVKRK